MTILTRGLSAAFFAAFAMPALATECIAPANPGGGWDFTCRQIGRIMTETGLDKNMVQVTNLAGAASSATTTRLAQNAFAGATADQVRWVGSIGGDPGVIVVGKDSPFKNLGDLVAAVKADPSKVAFAGGSAVGGFDHLKVLMMLDKAGFHDARKVKYIGMDGGADAITQTVGNFTQAMTGDLSEITGFIKSGDVRPLAVLSDARVAGFEDVPTAKEQGVDIVAVNWRGVYVPKDISDERYAHWVETLKKVGESEQWKTVMAENGLAPYTILGADFDKFVHDNIAEIHEISKEIGIVK